MSTRYAFEYAIIRVVPCLEREEFVNVGALVFCDAAEFLSARVAIDTRRLVELAPDVDLVLVREHVDAIELICRGGPAGGPIGGLPIRERFRWLVAPRSTIVQMSAAHPGLCQDPGESLEALLDRLVRCPAPAYAAPGQ